MPKSRNVNPEVARLRAQAAGFASRGNLEAAEDTRRQLKAVNAENYIRDLVESAPPLSPEDIDRLRALLPPVQDGGEDG